MKPLDIKKINKRYYKLFKNYEYVSQGHLDDNVQEINLNDEVFSLKSPWAGTLKDVKTDPTSKTEALLIRVVVSYKMMRDIEEDKYTGYYVCSNMINYMLAAAKKKINLDNAIVTFLRPHTE